MSAPVWADRRDLQTRTPETPAPAPPPYSAAAWAERARSLREQVRAAAGLWDDPAEMRQAPATEVRAPIRHPDLGYAVQRVVLETVPGYPLTATLLVPDGEAARRGPAPWPAVLHPHGHWPGGRLHHDGMHSVLARAVGLARMGMASLCPDMPGYGDAESLPHRWGDPADPLWCAGPLGLQLWNLIRCLDWLVSLPEVDATRLAVTGASGGATQTLLVTAVDDRVRASAPVNMVSLEYQGGCACEQAPGLRLGTSNLELAAMAAPRPLLVVSCTGDWTRHVQEQGGPWLQGLYATLGAPERLSWHREDAEHNYNRGSRLALYRFLGRWLGAGPPDPPPEDEDVSPVPAEHRVFAPGAAPVLPGSGLPGLVRAWIRQRTEADLAGLAQGLGGARRRLGAALAAANGLGTPRPPAVRREGRLVWLEHPQGGSLALEEGAVPGCPLDLLARDGRHLAIRTYTQGRGTQPWGRAGRAVGEEFFLTYNRGDAAWDAHDLWSALLWAGGATLVRAEPPGALPALLVGALAPELVDGVEVELPSGQDESSWLHPERFAVGLLRAGGLDGLVALLAPRPVRLRGLDRDLPIARRAYGALGADTRLALS